MLHRLRRPDGAAKRHKVVGRGRGSGHGKTSGRGHKGANARASGGTRPGYEGGQMPLIRRVPKRGFTFLPRPKFQIVALERLNRFAAGSQVDPKVLREADLVDKETVPVKILGDGSLDRALTIHAHAFSKSALEKIRASGGTAQTLRFERPKAPAAAASL